MNFVMLEGKISFLMPLFCGKIKTGLGDDRRIAQYFSTIFSARLVPYKSARACNVFFSGFSTKCEVFISLIFCPGKIREMRGNNVLHANLEEKK